MFWRNVFAVRILLIFISIIIITAGLSFSTIYVCLLGTAILLFAMLGKRIIRKIPMEIYFNIQE